MPMDWGLARDYAAKDVAEEGMTVTEAEWLAADHPDPSLPARQTTHAKVAAVCRRLHTPVSGRDR
jgi:hypothetical protein